jgi:hypothetical protein
MKKILIALAIAVVIASCHDRADTGNGSIDSTTRKVDVSNVAANDSSVSEQHLDTSKKQQADTTIKR